MDLAEPQNSDSVTIADHGIDVESAATSPVKEAEDVDIQLSPGNGSASGTVLPSSRSSSRASFGPDVEPSKKRGDVGTLPAVVEHQDHEDLDQPQEDVAVMR